MNVLAFLQARTNSSRFPGKVLFPILGKPMIQWEIERLSNSKYLNQVVVLTSDSPTDSKLAEFCTNNRVQVFRGSEKNVLQRFYDASLVFVPESMRGNTILARLTGDCPLVDTKMLDEAIESFIQEIKKGCRYYGYDPQLPDGMDFELFTWEALAETYRSSTDEFECEHVTPYMWRNPNRFQIKRYSTKGVTPGLRFSVDYPSDILLVEQILNFQTKTSKLLGALEISNFLLENPHLLDLNADITKNEGLILSAMNSKPFLTRVENRLLPRIGVFIEKLGEESQDLIHWAERMGIKVWKSNTQNLEFIKQTLSQNNLPEYLLLNETDTSLDWEIVMFDSKWQDQTKRHFLDSKRGVLFMVENRDQLVQILTYVCHTSYIT